MELRKTLRIALWEIRKSAGEVDRRTAVAGGIAVVLIAAGTPIIASSGINVDEGIYRVGISEESPYYEAVERNPALSVGDASREALREGTVDLLVLGTQVRATAPVSRKEKAAAAQLRKAVERYNTYLMKQEAQEGREAAAFPVEVRVEYLE
ncbi:MAG: PrsW family intramembrane metalloprotease, partial [Halobacteria archaeon]|nr:PrsW family intramembrane metalloprotease [Halobacteria archaeon]